MGNKCSKSNKHEKDRKEAEDLSSVRTQDNEFNNDNELKMEESDLSGNDSATVIVEEPMDGAEVEAEALTRQSSPFSSGEFPVSPKSEKTVEEDQIFTGTTLVETPMEDPMKISSIRSIKSQSSNGVNEARSVNEDVNEASVNDNLMCNENQNILEKQVIINMGDVDKLASLVAQKYGCSLGPSHDNSKCSICSTFDLSDAPLLA